MQKKVRIYILLLLITPIISGIYGVLHDQITYTISPEYFTNFKFIQFEISDYLRNSERLATSLIGFMATWWVGIPIGIILGFQGIKSLDSNYFLKIKTKALGITFFTTVIFGFIGFIFWKIFRYKYQDWPMNIGGRISNPELAEAFLQIKDIESFLAVGFIHNFSYIGGAIGLLIAIIFQIKKIKKLSNPS